MEEKSQLVKTFLKKNKTEGFIILFICLLAGFLLFWKLGDNFLSNWDEAWYADISRNIYFSGDPLRLKWNTQPFFEKPPLYFWLTAIMFKWWGVTEFSARFFSSLSSVILGIVVYFLGKSLADKWAGFTSALILFSSPIILFRSRTGNLDAMLVLFMTFSLASFFWGLERNRKWFLAMGVFLGLSFLTKGFVSIYPLIIILLYLLIQGKLKIITGKYFVIGLLAFLSMTIGWSVIYFLINGTIFLDQFLLSNTEKFDFGTSSLGNFSLQYFIYLKNGLKIWTLFLPLVVFVFIKNFNKNNKYNLLYLYFAVFFLVMSFSSNKSNWFILPLYPITSILISCSLFSLSRKPKIIFFATIVILAIALVQSYVYKKEYLVPDVSRDEASVAREATKYLNKNEALYLTNYYYPTIVYYSQRKVYAVYSDYEQSKNWWIRPKTEFVQILKRPNIYIITTINELSELRNSFPEQNFRTLFKSGDKLLVKKT